MEVSTTSEVGHDYPLVAIETSESYTSYASRVESTYT